MDRARAQSALPGGIIESIRHLPLNIGRLLGVRDNATAAKPRANGRHEQPATIDGELSRRIELARVVLISAILLHHVRVPAELSLFTWDNLGYVRGYLQFGLAKTATSTLTVISGFLLFSSRFELKPIAFICKKSRTLFIPMVIWNIPLALALLLFQMDGQYSLKYDDLTQGSVANWANALLGVWHEPVNYPLHFLRNIIACTVIGLFICGVFRRHALLTFAIIIVIGMTDIDGWLVTRNDMLIGFFFGAFIATSSIDTDWADFMFPGSIVFFLTSGFIMYYMQIDYDSMWGLGHRLLSFLAAWPALDYLSRRKLGHVLQKYSKYMFFIFLSHYYVMLLSFKIFSLFFSLEYFYIYFLVAAPVAIGVSIFGQIIAGRFMSPLLRIATGGRS